jgi:hypothetical protein
MSLWFDWQTAQNGALLKVVRRRSFRGDAARAEIRGHVVGDKGREEGRTSAGERSSVQGLVVHGRIIGENVSVRVIMVPACTMRAEKGEWLSRRG